MGNVRCSPLVSRQKSPNVKVLFGPLSGEFFPGKMGFRNFLKPIFFQEKILAHLLTTHYSKLLLVSDNTAIDEAVHDYRTQNTHQTRSAPPQPDTSR